MEMRLFTTSDWDCFAGAESPKNSEPFIGEFEGVKGDMVEYIAERSRNENFTVDVFDTYGFCIVVDAVGIQISNVDNTVTFTMECSFAAGIWIAERLDSKLSLAQLNGFDRS